MVKIKVYFVEMLHLAEKCDCFCSNSFIFSNEQHPVLSLCLFTTTVLRSQKDQNFL